MSAVLRRPLLAGSAVGGRRRRRPHWRGLGERVVVAQAPALYTTDTRPPQQPSGLGAPPFRFETGIALFAKRAPRPFPPPFMSPPSASFSDPLSTHDQSRDRRPQVNGCLIRGRTNGDDAVYASDRFICANDGVGAWSTRSRGHAGLWSRLILHFWAVEVDEAAARHRGSGPGDGYEPDPVAYLQHAYDQTVEATSAPNWQGTTTASGAQLHWHRSDPGDPAAAVVYVTNLGDSQVMVLRPGDRRVLHKTVPQWHWFDCPRQLGTNSPDTPARNAVMDVVDIRPGDVVLAMSDGVTDNLWEHEIVETVAASIERWEAGVGVGAGAGARAATRLSEGPRPDRTHGRSGGMQFAATALMEAARKIALDPFAESPYMEHAIEEGLASEGGKLDDISVVAALCVENR